MGEAVFCETKVRGGDFSSRTEGASRTGVTPFLSQRRLGLKCPVSQNDKPAGCGSQFSGFSHVAPASACLLGNRFKLKSKALAGEQTASPIGRNRRRADPAGCEPRKRRFRLFRQASEASSRVHLAAVSGSPSERILEFCWKTIVPPARRNSGKLAALKSLDKLPKKAYLLV